MLDDSERTHLWNHFLSRDADGTIGELVAFIEARDNAVRLALLDELEARSAGLIPYPMREHIAKLRLKYTPPRGKL
jgi:hypothetical protein